MNVIAQELRERFDKNENVFVLDNHGHELCITHVSTQINGDIEFWGSDNQGNEKQIYTDCLTAIL